VVNGEGVGRRCAPTTTGLCDRPRWKCGGPGLPACLVWGPLRWCIHEFEHRHLLVDTVQITDGLITAYRRILNPDKLSHLW